ncbi:hypothetical protein ACHAWC_009761 [Mediolabrus comicus]
MVAPLKQLPLLLLLQGSHVTAAAVTAEGDDIITAFAELPSGSTSFYAMHYSGQGCNNSTSSPSFVSLRGNLPGNSSAYHPASDENGTCAESSVCSVLFNSMDDSRCPVEGNFTGGEVREDGHVYLDYMNSTTDFTQCGPSGWYPGCYFEYYSLGALKSSPGLLANSDPADLEAMKDFIYYVYYEDDKCTDPASIWSSMAREAVTVDVVSNYTEYSCAVRSACVIDPNSALCEALRDGPDQTATFVSITALDESTGEQLAAGCHTDEAGQEDCTFVSPRDCMPSGIIPGCHLRFFSGSTLSKCPRILVGDMTGLPDLPDAGFVEGDSSQKPVDGANGAGKASLALGFGALYICWFVLF